MLKIRNACTYKMKRKDKVSYINDFDDISKRKLKIVILLINDKKL